MEDYTQFTMRINNKVYDLIKQSAVVNKRSIAKEIEYILEQWSKPPKDVPVSKDMDKAVRALLDVFKKEGII